VSRVSRDPGDSEGHQGNGSALGLQALWALVVPMNATGDTDNRPPTPVWATVKNQKGRFINISPSSYETYRACKRKWWYNKVQGLETPDTASTLLGTATHAVLDGYLEDRDGFVWDPKVQAHSIAQAGLHLLPPREVDVEGWVQDRCGPLPFLGRVDMSADVLPWRAGDERPHPGATMANLEGWLPWVGDHKTRGDLSWSKTAEELARDPQMLAYAYVLFRERWPEWRGAVALSHHNYRTKGIPVATRVDAIATWAQVEAAWRGFVAAAEDMARLALVSDHARIPPSTGACGQYGGCPFKSRCPASPENQQKNARSRAMTGAPVKKPGTPPTKKATPAAATATTEAPASTPTTSAESAAKKAAFKAKHGIGASTPNAPEAPKPGPGRKPVAPAKGQIVPSDAPTEPKGDAVKVAEQIRTATGITGFPFPWKSFKATMERNKISMDRAEEVLRAADLVLADDGDLVERAAPAAAPPKKATPAPAAAPPKKATTTKDPNAAKQTEAVAAIGEKLEAEGTISVAQAVEIAGTYFQRWHASRWEKIVTEATEGQSWEVQGDDVVAFGTEEEVPAEEEEEEVPAEEEEEETVEWTPEALWEALGALGYTTQQIERMTEETATHLASEGITNEGISIRKDGSFQLVTKSSPGEVEDPDEVTAPPVGDQVDTAEARAAGGASLTGGPGVFLGCLPDGLPIRNMAHVLAPYERAAAEAGAGQGPIPYVYALPFRDGSKAVASLLTADLYRNGWGKVLGAPMVFLDARHPAYDEVAHVLGSIPGAMIVRPIR